MLAALSAAKPAMGKDTWGRAVDAYQRGDTSLAQDLLRRHLADYPRHAEALHLLGVLLAREKHFPEAQACILAATEQAPERHDFQCNYALSQHEQGESAQAAALFRAVLARQPDFPPALNGLGSALHSLGDLTGAEHAFRRALQAQPGDPQAHNNLGNALQQQGQVEQAIVCYRKAIEVHPAYAEACYNLGVALKEQDRHEEARGNFERALRLKSEYHQATEQLDQVATFWREPVIGRRLVLRPYSEGDAAFIHRCFRDAAFMARYHRFISVNESPAKLAAALRQSAQTLPWRSSTVDWVITRQDETQRRIGLANLVDLDLHHRRAELLIGIPSEQERHAGAGLEATLLAMDFAFNRARLNKLTSLVYEGNGQAQKNALELGFMQEGYRPEHLRDSDGAGYIGVFENGMTTRDFRANQRLARLSQRLLGRDITNG